jgi:membrane protease YdiL (CAAX protease family)
VGEEDIPIDRISPCVNGRPIGVVARLGEEAVMNMSVEATAGNPPQVPYSRREQAIEVAVFLFLIGPSLVYSFIPSDSGGSVSFAFTAVATILRDLSLLALILFFFWRNREAVRGMGWTLRHMWRDIFLGIVLFVPMFFGAAWLDSFLTSIGFSSPPASGPSLEPGLSSPDLLLALALVNVVAVTEETIFRGYLIKRFSGVFGGSLISLLLSAFVFSIGHGYEGAAGVVTVGAMGLVFGLVYLWRKSLVAPVTMHFLQDFLAIILLPLLLGK